MLLEDVYVIDWAVAICSDLGACGWRAAAGRDSKAPRASQFVACVRGLVPFGLSRFCDTRLAALGELGDWADFLA